MNELDPKAIMAQAQAEVDMERFREAVDKAKEKIRAKRPFWDWIFPFRIVIISKNKELNND